MNSRERFEAWAESQLMDIKDSVIEGCYCEVETQMSWDAWQAALAQPIKLPAAPATLPTGDVVGVAKASGEHSMRKRCCEALRALGFEVVK